MRFVSIEKDKFFALAIKGTHTAHVKDNILQELTFQSAFELSPNLLFTDALPDIIDWADLIPGSWSAGDRYVQLHGVTTLVDVWFHFSPGGHVRLSMRHGDALHANSTDGRWWLEGGMLIVAMGNSMVRGKVEFRGNVMHWANEVLVRLPAELTEVAQPPSVGEEQTAQPTSVPITAWI